MVRNVLRSYNTANQIIWKHGGWKFLFLPLLISVVLLTTLAGGCFLMVSIIIAKIKEYTEEFFKVPDLLLNIFLILFTLISLAPFYIVFRSLVLVIYGPFLERISAKAEFVIDGTQNEVKKGVISSFKRPVTMLLLSILGSILISLCSYGLGLIPLAGIILSMVFVLPANMFMSSISYLDPYLDRSGYSIRKSLRVMLSNCLTLALFGIVGLLITAIPVLGWFVGPTYAVVAGVSLSILLHQKHEEKATRKLTVSS